MGEKDYFSLVSQAVEVVAEAFLPQQFEPDWQQSFEDLRKHNLGDDDGDGTVSSKSPRKPNNFESFLSHSRYRRHLLACLQNKRWNSLDDDDNFFFSVVHHLSARCDFFSHILLLSVFDGLFIVFLSLVGQTFQDLEARDIPLRAAEAIVKVFHPRTSPIKCFIHEIFMAATII